MGFGQLTAFSLKIKLNGGSIECRVMGVGDGTLGFRVKSLVAWFEGFGSTSWHRWVPKKFQEQLVYVFG